MVIHNPVMHNPKSLTWWPRGATFFIWLLLGLSVAYWWLLAQGKSAAPQVAPVSFPPANEPTVDKVVQALSGAAGVSAGAPAGAASAAAPGLAGDSRFSLVGVVAQAHGAGVALLGVEGQAAKPFRTGALVQEPYYLAEVLPQSVLLRTKDQTSGGLEIKLNPFPTKTAGGPSLAVLQPAVLPGGSGVTMPAPTPVAKADGAVTGAEEAQAPAVPRPNFGQALNAAIAGKGTDAAAKPGFSEMFRSAGGIAPPLPVASAAR